MQGNFLLAPQAASVQERERTAPDKRNHSRLNYEPMNLLRKPSHFERNDCQCQLRWGNGRLASLTGPIQSRQFPLEHLIQQFVPIVAQEYKQFSSPYPFHDVFF